MTTREDSGSRDAELIIFVHGAGVAGWMWKKQMEAFAGYRKIVVDLADHGLSMSQAFTGIGAAADEIAGLASGTAPGGKAHIVGHSLGAKIVLEVLSRHPEVVRSAVVSSALVRPSVLARMMNSHSLNAMSLWMLKSQAMARMQAAQFAFPDADMTEAFLADIAAMSAENLDRPVSAFAGRLFLPPGLERITCPVLVTAGSREPASMLGSLADIAGKIPGARCAVIDGARHNYPWTHHAVYNGLLVAFLGGSPLPTGGLMPG